MISEGNLDCRQAGTAFVGSHDVIVNEAQSNTRKRWAMWIRDKKRDTNESWFPYGVYRALWNGPPVTGEFARAGAGQTNARSPRTLTARQETAARVIYGYAVSWSDYSEYIFAELPVQLASNQKPRIGLHREDLQVHEGSGTRPSLTAATRTYRLERVREAINKALLDNVGLRVGLTIWVYDGPITDAELDAALAVRAERRRDPVAFCFKSKAIAAAQKAAKEERKAAKAAKRAKAVKLEEEEEEASEMALPALKRSALPSVEDSDDEKVVERTPAPRRKRAAAQSVEEDYKDIPLRHRRK